MQEAFAAFGESVAELAPAELLHMGMDSAGSRSLEAFLGSALSAKAKKRAIRKLAGSYAKLGSTPGGSHVAQACYRTAVSSAVHLLKGIKHPHLSSSMIPATELPRCVVHLVH